MKKSLIVGLLTSVVFLSFASLVFAADPITGTETLPTGVTTKAGFVGIINTAVNVIFVTFMLLAVVFLLLAAFQFLTGGGDPEALAQARSKIIWAAVGIAVALLARGIPAVVQNVLGINQ